MIYGNKIKYYSINQNLDGIRNIILEDIKFHGQKIEDCMIFFKGTKDREPGECGWITLNGVTFARL